MTPTGTLNGLLNLVQFLQGPDGCPWDREQTLEGSIQYLGLETAEAIEALKSKNPDAILEEMGDVIWVWAFLAELIRKELNLTPEELIERVEHKMIHRHPHVFGDEEFNTAQEVFDNWSALKERERKIYSEKRQAKQAK